ncbi:MAG: fasciclin domain-containing protein [Cyclobacteriaceae bacterium]|nr:fasciclin domain-containing protein [Cyclobacteriaceae bacterium]
MKQMKKQFNKYTQWMMSVSIIALLLFASSCKDDDDPVPEPEDNIMEIVDKTSTVSTLKAAIDAANLRATLSGDGPFTVFAPTNDAFAAVDPAVLAYLLATPAELTKVLTYHVISGKLMAADLNAGAATTVNGGAVTIGLTGGVTVNDANVKTADIEASNGVIHLIDKVLIPENLDLSGMVPSAAEAAIATPSLSTLVAILSLDGLSDILTAAANDDATLTVFAPTNDAFAAVLSALGLTSIDQIPESVLLDIVKYHIVGSVAKSTDLTATTYETLNGESVTVNLSSGVMVDDAKVEIADIMVSNGVVHVIDKVLLPSLYKSALGTIVEVPLFRKDYSILTAALVKADLVSTLLGAGPFTVFAPNNAAFEAAGITSLDGLTKEALAPILLYHVLGSKVLSSALTSEATTLSDAMKLYFSLGEMNYINGTTMITGVDIEKSNGVIHTIDKTLIPPSNTVVEIAVALSQATENAEFKTLVALLTNPAQQAVLDAISDADGNFTIFAPTDAAFDEISAVTATLSNEQISKVLTYHVIGSRIYSTDLINGAEPATVNGEKLKVNINDGVVTLTDKDQASADAKVITVNVNGKNGVIHVIDKVLIPTL